MPRTVHCPYFPKWILVKMQQSDLFSMNTSQVKTRMHSTKIVSSIDKILHVAFVSNSYLARVHLTRAIYPIHLKLFVDLDNSAQYCNVPFTVSFQFSTVSIDEYKNFLNKAK